MGRCKSLTEATDREKKWHKVFNASVKLLQNLQKEKQILGEKIKALHDVIYQMKLEQKVETSKSELIIGLKERETSVFKHRYEIACNELDDFKESLEYLSEKEPKITSNDVAKRSENKSLKEEVRKLRSEIEKYKLEKNSEINALLSEKNFVWNQFKNMEGDLKKQLKTKQEEVKRANEKVQLLVDRVDELQLSNEKLRTDFIKMESEATQKSEEISRLLKEIEILKARPESTLLPHKDGTDTNRIIRGRRVKTGNRESDPSHDSKKTARTRQTARESTGRKGPQKQLIEKLVKESSSSKRASSSSDGTMPDTLKLFSSSFKVPKLKNTKHDALAIEAPRFDMGKD